MIQQSIASLLNSISTAIATISAAVGPTGAVPPLDASQSGGEATNPTIGTPSLATAGRLKQIWVDLYGATVVRLIGPNEGDLFPDASAAGDGADNATPTSIIRSRLTAFNGTTWDRIRSGLNGVQTAVTGVLNDVPLAQYLSAAPTLANTNWYQLLSDIAGNLKITLATYIAGEDLSNNVLATSNRLIAAGTYSPSRSTSLGAAKSAVVKAAPGIVTSVVVSNTSASARYLALLNQTTTPADTNAPYIPSILVPAGSTVILGSDLFTSAGAYFPAGIAWGCATTFAPSGGAITLSATITDFHITVYYV